MKQIRFKLFLCKKILSTFFRVHFFPPHKTMCKQGYMHGIVAWRNAAKVHVQKLLVLQKRALRLMNYKPYQDHAIPLFLSTGTLPVTMIYVKESFIIIYDILKGDTPE